MAGLQPAPSNITIEVSGRPVVDAADLYYGIACRSDSSGSSNYEFQMNQGKAYIVKYANSNFTTLANGTFTAAPSNGENQLRAACTSAGNQNAVHLVFWVNGKKVGDTTDWTNSYRLGAIGLIAEKVSSATSAVEVGYHNFIVTQN